MPPADLGGRGLSASSLVQCSRGHWIAKSPSAVVGVCGGGRVERGTMVTRTTRDFHCQSLLRLGGNYNFGRRAPRSRSQLRGGRVAPRSPGARRRDPGAAGPATLRPEPH